MVKQDTMRGSMMLELMVAIGILATALIPLSYAFVYEQRLARAYYCRAVAMEIVDGEMEALAAGEWRAFSEGAQAYAVRGAAATNLPAGKFELTRRGQRLRLEWIPEGAAHGGLVVREAVGR